jgi:hypothetical protein
MTLELCVVLALLQVSAQMHHMFHFSRQVIHKTDFHAIKSPVTTSRFGPVCFCAINVRSNFSCAELQISMYDVCRERQ